MQLKFLILLVCVSATLALPSPRGKNANSNRELLKGSKAVYYLGDFDNKSYYIGFDLVTQEQARVGCQVEGLNLAATNSQAVLNFLFDVTFPSEDYSWTSGSSHFGNSAFHFDDGSAVNDDIDINSVSGYRPAYGLVIDRYADATDLRVQRVETLRFYFCST